MEEINYTFYSPKEFREIFDVSVHEMRDPWFWVNWKSAFTPLLNTIKNSHPSNAPFVSVSALDDDNYLMGDIGGVRVDDEILEYVEEFQLLRRKEKLNTSSYARSIKNVVETSFVTKRRTAKEKEAVKEKLRQDFKDLVTGKKEVYKQALEYKKAKKKKAA